MSAGSSASREQTVELPMQTREVRVMPQTVDADARTFEVVWSSGARVRRRGFVGDRFGAFDEELSLEPGHVDLARLNDGAPFLDTHDGFELSGVLGVVERAWIEGPKGRREGRAMVRLSDRAEVEPIWRDIQGGIIRNISVGYRVRRFETIEPGAAGDGAVPLRRAVDWEPIELSAVPMGADPKAKVRGEPAETWPCRIVNGAESARNEDPVMDEQTMAPAGEPGAEGVAEPSREAEAAAGAERVDPAAIRAQAIEAERQRVAGITSACRRLGLGDDVAQRMIEDGTALDQARAQIIDEAARRQPRISGAHIRPGEVDERETRCGAVRTALLHRFAPAAHPLSDAAREWRGMSLLEIARACLEANGVRTRGMARMEIARLALSHRAGGLHSTSDFAHVLADVSNKSLRDAYDAAPRTFGPFTRRATATDFKPINRVQLGEAPRLVRVGEHGEFTRGTIGDARETYALATFGRVFGITRQVIVDDDLDAFTRVLQLFGRAAADLESDTVWLVITGNAAMGDGTALFHANHGNLATGAISVSSVGAARALMRNQKGLDGVSLINVRPAYLIVPAALETVGEQFLSETLVPATQAAVVPASLRRSLELIVEPRLDVASTAQWYLSASPMQIDTIEYAYLEGEEGVVLETREGFDVDGLEIKARLDFAAKAIDWRGLVRSSGS